MMPIPWPQEFTPRYHGSEILTAAEGNSSAPWDGNGDHIKKRIYMHTEAWEYTWGPGVGAKASRAGNWHENTKGIAQLRSFFGNVDERVWSWGVLVRWNVRPTYWGDVCWRGRGREHMIILCCRSKRMRKFSKPNWWSLIGEDSKVHLRQRSSAGRSNAVQKRSWRWEVGPACAHNMKMKLGQDEGYPWNDRANHERRCDNELKRNEACPIDDANHEPAGERRGGCSFSPPNTLLNQEELQLANKC